MELKSIIDRIMASDQTHAKWLNTLSYLEHIGSRKIIKSQNSLELNLHLLQHIAEEARHAYFLKRLCERHFPRVCPNFRLEYLLGGKAAGNYFQAVDSHVEQSLKEVQGNTLNYLYVTWLIEERAMEVYNTYQDALKKHLFSINMGPLLAEEEIHLRETVDALKKADPFFEVRISTFKNRESELFSLFVQKLERDL